MELKSRTNQPVNGTINQDEIIGLDEEIREVINDVDSKKHRYLLYSNMIFDNGNGYDEYDFQLYLDEDELQFNNDGEITGISMDRTYVPNILHIVTNASTEVQYFHLEHYGVVIDGTLGVTMQYTIGGFTQSQADTGTIAIIDTETDAEYVVADI